MIFDLDHFMQKRFNSHFGRSRRTAEHALKPSISQGLAYNAMAGYLGITASLGDSVNMNAAVQLSSSGMLISANRTYPSK